MAMRVLGSSGNADNMWDKASSCIREATGELLEVSKETFSGHWEDVSHPEPISWAGPTLKNQYSSQANSWLDLLLNKRLNTYLKALKVINIHTFEHDL